MYLQLEESTAYTHFYVLFNLVWSHHWLKIPFFGHISCLLRLETTLLQILQQKTSRSKLGVLLPNMSMAVTWHQLRVGPSDMCLTRKASFKDTLFIGMHEGGPRPVFQGRNLECTFTRCKHPDCFSILYVRKIYSEGLFLIFLVSMLRTGCYAQQMKSTQFFNPSSVIYTYVGTDEF